MLQQGLLLLRFVSCSFTAVLILSLLLFLDLPVRTITCSSSHLTCSPVSHSIIISISTSLFPLVFCSLSQCFSSLFCFISSYFSVFIYYWIVPHPDPLYSVYLLGVLYSCSKTLYCFLSYALESLLFKSRDTFVCFQPEKHAEVRVHSVSVVSDSSLVFVLPCRARSEWRCPPVKQRRDKQIHTSLFTLQTNHKQEGDEPVQVL